MSGDLRTGDDDPRSGRLDPSTAIVPISLRAWTDATKPGRRPDATRGVPRLRDVLVIDTETTVDATQRLTFGFWSHLRVNDDGTTIRLAEGMFHGDDLPERDPDGFRVLRDYAASHRANVDLSTLGADSRLTLQSRAEFCYGTFRKLAYKARAHVVMFNKAFDLSRLAEHVGDARGNNRGGFSFRMTGPHFEKHNPRVRVKHIDSTKSFASFARPNSTEYQIAGGTNHGAFLDLRTWAFALTSRKHTLASACEAFGVEHGKASTEQHGIITEAYIDYGRRDVQATGELFEKLLAEHNLHPVELPPTQAYSPASVAKAYLRSMGISPLLGRCPLDPATLGRSMSTFYGGRAEVRIRHVPVPVELVDFTSMYPTVNSLMGLVDYYTAETIDTVDSTDAVRELLSTVTLEAMFDPSMWPQLVGMAQIIPDGDILPIRADYSNGGSYTIGLNPLTHDEPVWYTIADLVASRVLTGKPPAVIRAVSFEAHGKTSTLRPVKLRGALRVDPSKEDFFRVAVEERARVKGTDPELAAFLKVLVNAGSYGIWAQVDPRASVKPVPVNVWDHTGRSRPVDVAEPESPGDYCYPPIASAITGAARLMLAMAERCVTDAGGVWAFCDTDSLAIVTTDDAPGGEQIIQCPGGNERTSDGADGIRALTHDQVADIKRRFNRLSPYDRDAAPALLKTEYGGTGTDTVWCYAISAKRYAPYTLTSDGAIELVDEHWSEHGLGHLMDPSEPDPTSTSREWIAEYWRWLIGSALGNDVVEPDWFDRPAVGRFLVSTATLWHHFDDWNKGRPYADQVKPFNFLITCFASGLNDSGRLVAPYSRDAREWLSGDWRDVTTGSSLAPHLGTYGDPDRFESTVGPKPATNRIEVQSYRNVCMGHRRHPESKFLGPDGTPCSYQTVGLLQRRPTTVSIVRAIGKEANDLDATEAGLATTNDDHPVTDYTTPADTWPHALDALSSLTSSELAAKLDTGDTWSNRAAMSVDASHIRKVRRGARPSRALAAALRVLARDHVAAELMAAYPDRSVWEELARNGDLATLVRCRSELIGGPAARECECGCGQPVTGKAHYVGAAHRKAYQRSRERGAA